MNESKTRRSRGTVKEHYVIIDQTATMLMLILVVSACFKGVHLHVFPSFYIREQISRLPVRFPDGGSSSENGYIFNENKIAP